ncbi:hypothetical protein X976_3919 [Burkholderia pseudomallei MSHR7500]|nr:hypothetical protein X976_3919 [Burkholderia pseudomallei MSHR7500]
MSAWGIRPYIKTSNYEEQLRAWRGHFCWHRFFIWV